MNRQRFQQLFLDVDTAVAEQLVATMQLLEAGFQPQHAEDAGLSCHRLRGDARTVGFDVLATLVGALEDRLRIPQGGSEPDVGTLREMGRAAAEILRRMRAGEAACGEPLSADWLAWVGGPAQRLI